LTSEGDDVRIKAPFQYCLAMTYRGKNLDSGIVIVAETGKSCTMKWLAINNDWNQRAYAAFIRAERKKGRANPRVGRTLNRERIINYNR